MKNLQKIRLISSSDIYYNKLTDTFRNGCLKRERASNQDRILPPASSRRRQYFSPTKL